MSDDSSAKTVKVEINARGVYITVEMSGDDADLDRVKAVALELWREGRLDDKSAGPAVGFMGEVNTQWDHDRQSGHIARPVRAEADTGG